MAQQYSVAQAFDAADRGLTGFLHHALTLIDRVHTCALLPRVAFRHIDYPVEGEYRPTIPPQLIVDTGSRHKLSTTLHGIGHVLDQFAFSTGEYGAFETRKLREASYAGPLREWHAAVQATQTVRTLTYALNEPHKLRSILYPADIIPEKADVLYLLDAGELWARSYVQYLAVKTRDGALSAELQSMLNTHAFSLFDQWPPEEYAFIEAAIDAMFAKLGWRAP